jgi:hypothetical protein
MADKAEAREAVKAMRAVRQFMRAQMKLPKD